MAKQNVENVADGRRLRSERSRQAIIDAMLKLVEEGVLVPTAQQVSERAGVGIRSAWFTGTSASVVLDGTSHAAPYVAGAIARYLNIYPATTPAQMSTVLIGAATPNVVSNAGTGTPNRLLFRDPAQ